MSGRTRSIDGSNGVQRRKALITKSASILKSARPRRAGGVGRTGASAAACLLLLLVSEFAPASGVAGGPAAARGSAGSSGAAITGSPRCAAARTASSSGESVSPAAPAPATNEIATKLEPAESALAQARLDLANDGYLPRELAVLPGDVKKASAKPDQRLRFAVLAFQRVTGRQQTGEMGADDIKALSTAAAPESLEKGYAHVEIDLKRQVLLVVEADGSVKRVLPISSGSGKLYTFQGKTERAVTPCGRFAVYNKISGWRKAPLGMIYYPCYFNKGVAIHGSPSVPNYPASHGCVRIPIVTAKELSDLVPMGMVVLVHD